MNFSQFKSSIIKEENNPIYDESSSQDRLTEFEQLLPNLFQMKKQIQQKLNCQPDSLKELKKELEIFIQHSSRKYDYHKILTNPQNINSSKHSEKNSKQSIFQGIDKYFQKITQSNSSNINQVNEQNSIGQNITSDSQKKGIKKLSSEEQQFQVLVAASISGLDKLVDLLQYPILLVKPYIAKLMKDPEVYKDFINEEDPFFQILQLIQKIQKDFEQSDISNISNSSIDHLRRVYQPKSMQKNEITSPNTKQNINQNFSYEEKSQRKPPINLNRDPSEQPIKSKTDNKLKCDSILPVHISKLLNKIQQYYKTYQKQWNEFLNTLDKIERKKLVIEIQNFYQNFPSIEISGPFIGIYMVNKETYKQLIDSQKQWEFEENIIQIKRIGKEFIHSQQRNFALFLLLKFIFGVDVLPVVAMRTLELDIEKNNKPKRTFYQLAYGFNLKKTKIYKLDDFQQTDSGVSYEQKNQMGEVIKKVKINPLSFLKQLIAAIFATPIENYIPNYVVLENGDIVRNFIDISNEDRAQFSGIKNPLFFFKNYLQQLNAKEFDLLNNLMQRDYLYLFFSSLKFISYAEVTDFQLEIKDGRLVNSLLISKGQINGIFDLLRQFYSVFIWLEEVVLPISENIGIYQIIQKLWPIITEFSERITSDNIKDHNSFMKKIAIEEFLQRNIKKKNLKKYLDAIRCFDEIADKTQQQFTSERSDSFKLQKLDEILSTKNQICQWLINIDLNELSTVQNRSIILKFVSENFFFQDYFDTNFLKTIHQSFFDKSLWKEVLEFIKHNNKNKGSIFIELLGLVLNVGVENIQGHQLFSFLEIYDENQFTTNLNGYDNWNLYLSCEKIKGDKGYPSRLTLLERALEYRKYKVCLKLLDLGEGQNIQSDTLTKFFILEAKKTGQNSYILGMQKQILEKLRKLHQALVSSFEWERIWLQILPSNDTKLLKSHIKFQVEDSELEGTSDNKLNKYISTKSNIPLSQNNSKNIPNLNNKSQIINQEQLNNSQQLQNMDIKLYTREFGVKLLSKEIVEQIYHYINNEAAEQNQLYMEKKIVEEIQQSQSENSSQQDSQLNSDVESVKKQTENQNNNSKLKGELNSPLHKIQLLFKLIKLENDYDQYLTDEDQNINENSIHLQTQEDEEETHKNIKKPMFQKKFVDYIQYYCQEKKRKTHKLPRIQVIDIQENFKIIVQQNPKYPGLTYFYDSFMNIFNNFGRTKKVLGRINNTEHMFQQYIKDGVTLAQAFNYVNFPIENILEKKSLGERILVSMLMYESYVPPEDEVLEIHPENSDLLRLVNIGDSRCFVKNIIKKQDKCYINVKNVLFCMDQMKEVIEEDLVEKFSNFVGEDKCPEQIIRHLIYNLVEYQKDLIQRKILDPKIFKEQYQYFEVIENNINIEESYNVQQENDSDSQKFLEWGYILDPNYTKTFLGIPLQKFQFKELLDRFKKMIQAFQFKKKAKELKKFRYIDLFKIIDPVLAKYYEIVLENPNIPIPYRFKLICKSIPNFQGVGDGNQPTFDEHFMLKNSIREEENEFDEIVENFQHYGTTQILQKFKKYRKIYPKSSLEQDRNLKSTLYNLTSKKELNTFLNALEFNYAPEAQQNQFLEDFQTWQKYFQSNYGDEISQITLQNLPVLNFKKLHTNINLERITCLTLINCPNINDADINQINDKCQSLTYLKLQNIPNITNISNSKISNVQYLSKSIKFKILKTLIVENMPNLILVDIQGIHIQSLSFNDCPKLETLLQDCIELKSVSLYNCNSLLSEIVSILIIQGIKVGFNHQTCQGAFKDYIQKYNINTDNALKKQDIMTQIYIDIFNEIVYSNSQLQLIHYFIKLNIDKSYLSTYNLESLWSNFLNKSKKKIQNTLISDFRLQLTKLLITNRYMTYLDFRYIPQYLTDFGELLFQLSSAFNFFKKTQSSKAQQKNQIYLNNINLEGFSEPFNLDSHIQELCAFLASIYSTHSDLKVQLKGFQNKLNLDYIKQKTQQLEDNLNQQIENTGAHENQQQQQIQNIKKDSEEEKKQEQQDSSQIQQQAQQKEKRKTSQKESFKYIQDLVKAICDNKHISYLDLSRTYLSKETFRDLFENIKFASSIILNECNIDDDLLKLISSSLGTRKSIKLLDLSKNQITKEGVNELADQLINNRYLQILKLDENDLNGTLFDKFINIQTLSLQKTQLKLEDFEKINQMFDLDTKLELLDLSNNQIEIQGLDLIVQGILKRNNLKELKIKNIIQKGVQQNEKEKFLNIIKNLICNSKSLQSLNISANDISDQGLKLVADGLIENKKLKILVIKKDYSFTQSGLHFIVQALKKNQCLSFFDFDIEGEKQNEQKAQSNPLSSNFPFQFKAQIQPYADISQNYNIQNQQINYIKDQQNQSQNDTDISFENSFFLKENVKNLNQNDMEDLIIKKKIAFKTKQEIQNLLKKNTKNFKNQLNQLQQSQIQYQIDEEQIMNKNNRYDKFDYFKVGLSIDGGGMRGIIPGVMLEYLAKETKQEPFQMFDCVGGTSIGGIIALGVTGTLDGRNPIVPSTGITNFFETHGADIFNKSKIVQIWNNLMDRSKYDPIGLQECLNNYFQNAKLSDILPGTNVLVTSVKREINRIQGKNSAKIFRSRQAVFDQNKNFYMRDVGRATSAAPTFFPSAEIQNISGSKSYSLIDGGIGQNNPAKFVLDDIKKEALNSGNENNFFLVSLGTGILKVTSSIDKNSGLLNILPLIEGIQESGIHYVEKDIEKNYSGHYVRAQPLVPLDKSKADLDSIEPSILQQYKECALDIAIESFTQKEIYGQYFDRSLVDWLAENTARKRDFFV